MINEALFFLTIVLNFIGVFVIFKLFGKTGLFAWIGFAIILANIEVIKCVDLFTLALTIGNVIYGTIFLATDVLSEYYGEKEARRAVFIGFVIMVSFTIFIQVDLLFVPNSEDFASEAMETIFSLLPRICIASVLTYIVSNLMDTYLYGWWRKTKFCQNDKNMWIRNNGSTLISQAVDSIMFALIAYVGLFPMEIVLELALTTYAIKVLIALLDTPFLYCIKKYIPKGSKPILSDETI